MRKPGAAALDAAHFVPRGAIDGTHLPPARAYIARGRGKGAPRACRLRVGVPVMCPLADAAGFAAQRCATHRRAPCEPWMRPALRPARIPIRVPAGAATDRGRRATGRAGGERAAAPQHLTFYMVIHWRSTHRDNVIAFFGRPRTAAPHLFRGDSLEIDASTCVVALFGRPRTAAPTSFVVIHWRSTHRHASSPYLAGLAPQRFTSTKVLALR
jgi:hypothetical protein